MAVPVSSFLEPIAALQQKIRELEKEQTSIEIAEALVAARQELRDTIDTIFHNLTPWQTCQLARHPERPYTLDYIHGMMTEFTELHGDRRFADDAAIVAGFALFDGDPVAVIGHQKGRSTTEKVWRNFGMPRPEGYRKALRIMKMAARFSLPIVTFIDTPGAYPGIDAEERGQAEAIASNLLEMSRLPVPILCIITGEGGSGGALGLGVGDRILMLKYAIYSVISPEGCAAILWKDQSRAEQAAEALRLTAKDLKRLGVVDEVLEEPRGGAHMDPPAMAITLADALRRYLKQLRRLKPEVLIDKRYRKFRAMGKCLER